MTNETSKGGGKKLFPVLLLKGYCPGNPYRVERDGQMVDVTPPENAVRSIYDKVEKGALVELEVAEAKDVIKKKIGERADGEIGIG